MHLAQRGLAIAVPAATTIVSPPADGSSVFGMIGSWNVPATPRGRVLRLFADELDCPKLESDIEDRPSGPYVSAARLAPACKDPA